MTLDEITKVAKDRKVLDVGCGREKFQSSYGIDFSKNSLADVIHNLNTFPYPLPDSTFDVILCRNVIEHISDVVGLMEEIHRVAKNNADVIITTPHFSSLYSYQDPTHVRHLAYDSMDYFTGENPDFLNFYSDSNFKTIQKKIDFGKSFLFSSIAKLLFRFSARMYEKHFAFIFPANSLSFHLKVIKKTEL